MNGNCIFWVKRTGGNAVGDILFLNNNAADSTSAGLSNVVMTLQSGGNVGIGTQTPTAKLEVVGAVKATQLCIGSNCQTSWPAIPSIDCNWTGWLNNGATGVYGCTYGCGASVKIADSFCSGGKVTQMQSNTVCTQCIGGW